MQQLIIRHLGTQDYLTCWKNMREFTNQRTKQTPDEIWLLQHPSVFTQGQNSKAEHILQTSTIPIISTDRGGQVTYHGPGQLIAYVLIDLERKKYNIRQLVTLIEDSVISLLAKFSISAQAKREAPGIYIHQEKICSIGLRVRRGCSYHGLALNVEMDLTPFNDINPCGFANLKMTQLATFLSPIDFQQISRELSEELANKLGYTTILQGGQAQDPPLPST